MSSIGSAGISSLMFILLFLPQVSFAQPAGDFPTLLPPRKEFPPTFLEQHGLTLLWLTLAVLIIIGAMTWLAFRKKSRAAIPPEIEARRALEAIQGRPMTGEALGRISQILRRYCAIAFTGKPAEFTTGEIRELVQRDHHLHSTDATDLVQFLSRCDELRFAPTPPPDDADFAGSALSFVQRLESTCPRQEDKPVIMR